MNVRKSLALVPSIEPERMALMRDAYDIVASFSPGGEVYRIAGADGSGGIPTDSLAKALKLAAEEGEDLVADLAELGFVVEAGGGAAKGHGRIGAWWVVKAAAPAGRITAREAARRTNPKTWKDIEPDPTAAKPWTSFFSARVRDAEDKLKEEIAKSPNVRTTAADWRSCLDWQSHLMSGSFNIGESGTATATGASSLTNSGAGFPTTNNGYKGHIVVASSDSGSIAYGIITSNTSTVLTIDKWYVAATPSGSAATTPAATSKYMILPGQAPAWWITLGDTSAGSGASDTSVPNELTTSGFARAVWTTYTHTSGATSFLVSKVFTATGTKTVYRAALLGASAGGAMPFESDLTDIAVCESGDTLTINTTVSI